MSNTHPTSRQRPSHMEHGLSCILGPTRGANPSHRQTAQYNPLPKEKSSTQQCLEVRDKIIKRLAGWGWGSKGFCASSTIYNACIASIPAFLLQAVEPMDKLETWPFGNMAMFIAAPVVGQGVSRADLWHLTNTFGMLQNLRSWQDTPLAARGRVALVPPPSAGWSPALCTLPRAC